ncbi:MAG: hypothetical protein PHV34_11600 [Verrucomicrobiae bacterium]|nr:hypothetical protein [Verrucomicrobiae bacterium]
MSKIYLINVGANMADKSIVRSPVFSDGGFYYAPFTKEGVNGYMKFSNEIRPFVQRHKMNGRDIHCDPDWKNLTYGDGWCRRSAALWHAERNDIFLFWALLWKNNGKGWIEWTDKKREQTDGDDPRQWCLIGAIRIDEILDEGQHPSDATARNRLRAKANAHVFKGLIGKDNRVFIGQKRHSMLFEKAVDLGIYKSSSLLLKTVRTASGEKLNWHHGIRWNFSTRACRAICDLTTHDGWKRAIILRNSIRKKNPNFDLLAGLTWP